MNKNQGYTLVEVMIALAISAIVMSVLISLYLASYERYRLQHALMHHQEQALNAIDIVKTAIQRAGYIGCAKLTDTFPIQSYQQYSISPQTQLTGNQESFTVRYAEWPAAVLMTAMQNDSVMTTDNAARVSKGNIALIADCERAEIFAVASVYRVRDHQLIVSTQPLHHRFGAGAEVSRFVINTYWIRPGARKDKQGVAVPALALRDIHHQVTELVEQVARMQVIYTQRNGVAVGAGVALLIATPPVKKYWHVYALSEGEADAR